MMGSKFTTQGWSKAVQKHDFGDDPKVKYTSAKSDDGKTGKTENVGDVLNKIANPTGKDTGGHHVRRAHNQLDKDDFLKLMLTQMKNQDPMNPMQSHEMAAQLAQFTSLEQLFNVNKNLEGLSSKQDPLTKFEALNLLGKTIKSDTRQIFHAAGDTDNELRFKLSADAAKVKIKVSDDFGQPVREIEVENLKEGMAKVVWDGKDSTDRDVRAGKYVFSLEALNTRGEKVFAQTETKGTITGVNYTPEGPLLMIGDQKIRLQDIQRIEDSNLKEQQNNLESKQMGTPQELSKGGVPQEVLAAAMKQAENSDSIQAKAVVKSKPQAQGGPKMGDVTMPLELASHVAAPGTTGLKK